MPIYANAGDILEVRLRGVLFEQHVMTVLHYKITDVEPDILLSVCITALNTDLGGVDDLYDSYYKCLSEDYTAQDTEIQRIAPLRQIAYNFEPYAGIGNVASTALPPGVSMAVTKRAEGSGRDCVGGCRLPAVPTLFNDAGRVTLLGTDALQQFCDQLKQVSEVTGVATFTPIILHRASPSDSQIVYDAFPMDTIRTMSRRVVGRGI